MKRNLFSLLLSLLFSQTHFGQSFTSLCEGTNTNGTVVAFETYNDTIYATGFFSTVCGQAANYVAKWENNSWQPSLSIELSDPGHSLKTINGNMYIAKYEESIDSNWVYVYDGTSLQTLGSGVYLSTASGFSQLPNIYDIVEFNGNIVACGEFDKVGQEVISGIMQWNGTNWQPLAGGLQGNIQNTAPVIYPHQMLVYNDALYVVGNFRYANGIQVNGVAKWDGNTWFPMGSGFNNTVYSIIAFNNEIIVGGSFTASNGQDLNRIAKWDGSQWVSLGLGFTATSPNDFIFVHTLKVIDDELYITGGLKQIAYDTGFVEPCGGIVKYSSQASIHTFSGGISGNDIEAVIKDGNQKLLIGGGVFGSGYLGISDFSLALATTTMHNRIAVYPNPFTNEIHLQTDLNLSGYIITDLCGREIIKNWGTTKTLELSGLQAGTYLLKLFDNKQNYYRKIVKQ